MLLHLWCSKCLKACVNFEKRCAYCNDELSVRSRRKRSRKRQDWQRGFIQLGHFPLQKGSVPIHLSPQRCLAAPITLLLGGSKMSFTYTEKIRPTIIGLLEEGEITLTDIAKLCNVSIAFVRRVVDSYDQFYSKSKDEAQKRSLGLYAQHWIQGIRPMVGRDNDSWNNIGMVDWY